MRLEYCVSNTCDGIEERIDRLSGCDWYLVEGEGGKTIWARKGRCVDGDCGTCIVYVDKVKIWGSIERITGKPNSLDSK